MARPPSKRSKPLRERELGDWRLRIADFALNRASAAMLILSRDGFIVHVNQAACEQSGLSEAQLVGRSIQIIDEKITSTWWQRGWPRLVREGSTSFESEWCLREGPKAGQRVLMQVRADYLVFEGEEYSISYSYDIGARRAAELALKASEQRFRAITESVSDIILIMDLQAVLRYVGPPVEAALGFAPADLIGQEIWSFVHPTEHDDLRTRMARFVAYTSTVAATPAPSNDALRTRFELRVRAASGAWRSMSALVTNCVKDPAVQGIVASLRDVTERIEAEEALRTQRECLLYHRTQLLELARADRSDLRTALQQALVMLTTTLDVAHASFWGVAQAGRALVCEMDYAAADRSLVVQAEGVTLSQADYPAYFEAMFKAEPVVARNAATHPLTAQFVRNIRAQADPRVITSMLDLPIMLQGRLVGMLCLEHEGTPRTWQPDEIDFGTNAVTIIALAIEEAERRGFQSRLQYMAHHDTLTGLPNRQLLHDRIHIAIKAAQREERQLAVLFVDLDRFKPINDSLGHDVGDEVLKEAARRMQACVRAGDTVARLGGDEFVVMLPSVEPQTAAALPEAAGLRVAEQVATKVIRQLNAPFMVREHELHLSGSIGIAMYPCDGADVATLMKHADIAMYAAKEQGRDRLQFFQAELNVRAAARLTLENSLRRAIRQGQLALYYQPQVGLCGRLQGQLFGLEALVRWQHADGLLLPERFLPIAEESGLMVELSRWVLETAIAQRAVWHKEDASGVRQVPLAVNVPARQFHDRNLPKTIQSILRDCHLPAPLLELEVTESTLMQPSDASADVLRALRDVGVKLSIDDFGTGFSSFAQLKHFPLSKLKIDQSFVQQVTTNQSDAGITQAIISMACHLGIASVAEGVETRAQQAFLADAGCTAMQGFVHCKPLPGEALSAFLAASSQPVVTTAVTARLH